MIGTTGAPWIYAIGARFNIGGGVAISRCRCQARKAHQHRRKIDLIAVAFNAVKFAVFVIASPIQLPRSAGFEAN